MSNIAKAVAAYRYAFAIWTDRADFITDKTTDWREDALLEIRCFDENGEYHAVRDIPGHPFSEREIAKDPARAATEARVMDEREFYADIFEAAEKKKGYFEEAQYLDIDSKMTEAKKDGWVYTIGGGRYHLPDDAKNRAMILVRYYYRFDPDGVAHKYDWRLVRFTDEETVGKEKHNGDASA